MNKKPEDRLLQWDMEKNCWRMELTQGQWALFDEADLLKVLPYTWYARWDKHTKSYYVANGKHHLQMHRVVMDCPAGMQVDHINHDTLDNRQENLRIVTAAGNQANARLRVDSTSGTAGVSRYSRSNKWQARGQLDGVRQHLGYFDNKDDAVAARKAWEAQRAPH